MTPEERYNQQVWEILQDIKEELLVTVSGKPVEFRVPDVIGGGIIPKDRQINILYKLEEENALTIHKNAEGVKIGTLNIFYLFIDPANFNIVYEKYQRACNLNSYLDEYGKSLYKGEKIPPSFSVVEKSNVNSPSIAGSSHSKTPSQIRSKYNKLIDEIKSSSTPTLEQQYKQLINGVTKEDRHTIKSEAPLTDTKISNLDNDPTMKEPKNTALPDGWLLEEEENIPSIKHNGNTVFSFPNNWSNKYIYFKLLWKNYGIKIDYKSIYESKQNFRYPKKGVWKTNHKIRDVINKLRKELKNNNLPINIETNKGFTLTI